MFDILIKNATILDGLGGEGYIADVAIRDGKIQKIGAQEESASRVIDARGLVLTPGFIDSHSHGERSITTDKDHAQSLQQGITFAVGGQCGSSAAPSKAASSYPSVKAWLESMGDQPTGVNVGMLVGHGTLRIAAMGRENRAPTEAELTQMAQLLEQAMDEGAMGMSMGLYYTPGSYAGSHELQTLARIVGKRGGILAAHIRNESDKLLEAVDEFIETCRVGGCRGVISHMKAAEKPNHYKMSLVLERVEKAVAEGIDLYGDAYPYCASSTTLASRFIPREFIPEGTVNPTDLLEDPGFRERVRAWGKEKWGNDLRFVLVVGCKGHPEFAGKNLNEIAELTGAPDPYEAVFNILREKGQRCQCCFFSMAEENVAKTLAYPRVMIGCDADQGSMATLFHPRRVGTFPRVLGRYVRQQGITTLPEMIRKMTSLPAYVYGLENKGRIAEGYDADICIFDPETILDTADYVNCASPNQGLHYVLVGGKVAVEQGVYNGTRGGKLYARGK